MHVGGFGPVAEDNTVATCNNFSPSVKNATPGVEFNYSFFFGREGWKAAANCSVCG